MPRPGAASRAPPTLAGVESQACPPPHGKAVASASVANGNTSVDASPPNGPAPGGGADRWRRACKSVSANATSVDGNVSAAGPSSTEGAAVASSVAAPSAAQPSRPPEAHSDGLPTDPAAAAPSASSEEPKEQKNVCAKVWAALVDYTLEALDAGIIQVLLLFVLPLVLSLNFLSSLIRPYFLPKPPEIPFGHPPSVPPPPPPPDMVGEVFDDLMEFAFDNPALYFFYNFAAFLAVALFVLFLDDINRWRERLKAEAIASKAKAARAANAQALRDQRRASLTGGVDGYLALGDDEEDLEALVAATEEEERKRAQKPNIDLPTMKRELHLVTDKAEELEIKSRVNRKSNSVAAVAMRAELKQLQDRREELRAALHDFLSRPVEKKPEEEDGTPKRPPSLIAQFAKSTFVQVSINTGNGLLSVSLYFADLLSDVQVIQLLWTAGNSAWAMTSVTILVVQFGVVYLRCLPCASASNLPLPLSRSLRDFH
jgi:hypothetical protein